MKLSRVLLIILTVGVSLLVAGWILPPVFSSATKSEEAETRKIVENALSYFDISTEYASSVISSVDIVTITDDQTPYLSSRLIGKEVYRVEIPDDLLRQTHDLDNPRTLPNRGFFVFLDKTGVLLKIESIDKSNFYLPAVEAEKQLSELQEVYHEFIIGERPKTSLSKAIAACPIQEPYSSERIIAYYIKWSRWGLEIKNVWVIDFQGIDPMPSLYQEYSNSKSSNSNKHTRVIIDDGTGDYLISSNTPIL